MRLVGCQYCKKARAFWAYDSHGSPHGSYQNAHIEVGTNVHIAEKSERILSFVAIQIRSVDISTCLQMTAL